MIYSKREIIKKILDVKILKQSEWNKCPHMNIADLLVYGAIGSPKMTICIQDGIYHKSAMSIQKDE